ncbi:MAG: hypothetical protein JSU77_11910 [Fidelibacterota bacterium]|nr:MAG: hypothetical protein JSU77_11910 [Candidatus Neomarinimicrobiota bacterium]
MNENNIRQLFRWITVIVIVGAPFAAEAQTHTMEIGAGQFRLAVASLMTHRGERLTYPYEYRAYQAKHRYMRRKCAEGGGVIVAARDFQAKAYYAREKADPADWTVADTLLPYVVADATGWYTYDMNHTTVPVDGGARRYWRQRPTIKIVNNVDRSTSNPDQKWTDGKDFDGPADMPTDQMGVATVHTYIGISITERAYVFDNGEFAIVEFVFKNTGKTGSNYDDGQEITYSDSVKGAYVGIKMRPVLANEDVVENSGGWTEGTDDWVSYTETEDGDQLRVVYGWDGDAGDYYRAEEDEGDPYLGSSGVLTASQYPGMAVLHADRSVNDHTDDPDQPHRFYASWGGTFSPNILTMGRDLSFADIYQILDEGPDSPEPFDWTGWKNAGSPEVEDQFWTGYNTPHATDENRYNQCGTLAFGPYDFGIDDSVRIVLCYSAGTINWESAINVGAEYVEGTISKGQKNVILRSGRDSLFTKIKWVQELFNDRFASNDGDLYLTLQQISEEIGVPPAWPDNMTQNPVVGGCRIEWSPVDGAQAYRVYRRDQVDFDLSEPVPTVYSLVYQCGGADPGGSVEYSPTIGATAWVDSSVFPVYNYWYYVTAIGDDGTESSHFIGRTWPKSTDYIYGSIQPYDRERENLDDVHIIPNPYNAKSLKVYDWPQDKLTFYGLPANCRIRIYSQNGVLVFKHNHASEGDLPVSNFNWDMRSASDQTIASGMYIYVIDQCRGYSGEEIEATKAGKFVVIR